MRFKDTVELAKWRAEVRDFIGRHWGEPGTGSPFMTMMGDFDELRVDKWLNALGSNGWIAAAWPKRYGGADLSVREQLVLSQEIASVSAPTSRRMLNLVGPTIMLHGSEEQKRQHLPPMLRGEVEWCQGFSEPGAGSDLASLRTLAVRQGDYYLINGQKIWTSGAHHADWMFMLTRTDTTAPKHRGITYFLVDMRSPGISVRPLRSLDGAHRFNEVFFEDVLVPVSNRVGEENRGWYVGTTTLDFERSNIGLAITARRTLKELAGRVVLPASDVVRHEMAERAVEIAVAELFSYEVVAIQAAGGVPNLEASRCKMFGTEMWQRLARTQMKLAGMSGQLMEGTSSTVPQFPFGPLEYLNTLATTIAGGTSEIQRDIIATRGLGLPRA